MSQTDPNSSNLLAKFQTAVEDLRYSSESDYPFNVQLWQEQTAEILTPDRLLNAVKKPDNEPVELVTPETFFARLVQEREWHGDVEKAIGDRFKTLFTLITDTLTDINIYRVGTIEIDIYIVGRVNQTEWIILSTKAIET